MNSTTFGGGTTFASEANPLFFVLNVTGQIVKAENFENLENLYCQYGFAYGPDWTVIHGIERGTSQVSHVSSSIDSMFIFNFPIEISFKSTNVYGWPQLVVALYNVDARGNDIIRGYGSCHIPTTLGRSVCTLRLFRPDSSSLFQRITAWATGVRPEFVDAFHPARSTGRDVTRTRSEGVLHVSLDLTTKYIEQLGYEMGKPSQ
eukprot:GCRY01004793.1.p1 GENE.GCRY01004793.1~~GCRY01004793.1.p1  ORF type:complete len:204 (+),score=22.89 GCRY01004793.1:197-808(+)